MCTHTEYVCINHYTAVAAATVVAAQKNIIIYVYEDKITKRNLNACRRCEKSRHKAYGTSMNEANEGDFVHNVNGRSKSNEQKTRTHTDTSFVSNE